MINPQTQQVLTSNYGVRAANSITRALSNSITRGTFKVRSWFYQWELMPSGDQLIITPREVTHHDDY